MGAISHIKNAVRGATSRTYASFCVRQPRVFDPAGVVVVLAPNGVTSFSGYLHVFMYASLS